jgi:isopentenyl phosphate kinase
MEQRIVIKIGGSVITRKDAQSFPMDIDTIKKTAENYIRSDRMVSLSNQIKVALQNDKNIRIIIINGVGPFGHYLVKNKVPSKTVRESVRYLNDIFVSYFSKLDLPIVTLPPSDYVSYSNGKFDMRRLLKKAKEVMDNGKIVSTYGDQLKNGKVVSGDDLLLSLAEFWEAQKIISVSDVKGIYNKPPHKPGAKLIKTVHAHAYEVAEYDMPNIDVTGGLLGKVEKLKEAAMIGIKSQMITGMDDDFLRRAILGDESLGTMILP